MLDNSLLSDIREENLKVYRSSPQRLREDVGRITQVLAGELELLIRAAPEQWHLFQPNSYFSLPGRVAGFKPG